MDDDEVTAAYLEDYDLIEAENKVLQFLVGLLISLLTEKAPRNPGGLRLTRTV